MVIYMHINPDHYLETEHGRVFTAQRNKEAWKKCFADLRHELMNNPAVKKIYILIGCQGSGKSTWANWKKVEEPDNIIFDALLVKRNERQKIIQIASLQEIECIAVFFNTSLSVCLERNVQRKADHYINENALINVYSLIEKPSIQEGFSEIIIID